MASANWLKLSGGTDVKSKFRHCDKDERLKVKHANEDIDINLTHKNLSFGIFQGTYKEACTAYDERIKYIDKHAGLKKKPRKDRVTCVSWSIPQPEGMSDDMASKWFTDVYALLNTEYSDVLGASAHFDEVHEYVDASTGETAVSRPHMHVYVLPVVEKDGFRRLVGKDFSKRENMVKLNNSIQKLTEDKYPGYTFMTGVKRPGKYQSVEDLKRQSKIEQALQAEKEKVKQEIEAEKSNALQVIDGAKDDVVNMAIALDRQNAERESKLNAREAQLAAYEIKVKDVESSMDASVSKYMHTKKFIRDGQPILLIDMFKEWAQAQEKAANAKKQSIPKHSPTTKPVDYVQKAISEATRQVVDKVVKDSSESIKRKSLILPWSQDEQSGDELSY